MLFSKPSGVSWLVVFLGNPGPRYEGTRHNAGFMTADAFARAHKVDINRVRFHALTGVCELGEEKVLLMKPQTFMNLSGEAAGEAARFYKIPSQHVLVVSDEIALHNGLKSIIACLGTEEFPRIRLGVGAPPHPDYDMADWVLASFKNQDAEDMAKSAARAAEAVECYILHGPEQTMNRYNG